MWQSQVSLIQILFSHHQGVLKADDALGEGDRAEGGMYDGGRDIVYIICRLFDCCTVMTLMLFSTIYVIIQLVLSCFHTD